MSFMRKIMAAAFARVAYSVLKLAGWKRKTVLANAKHVADAVPLDAVLYKALLKNLTRHVG